MRDPGFEKHTQIPFMYYGKEIEVDEGILELLTLMWARGITTIFSCQGDVKFRDQTCWSNDGYRGYVMMERTYESLLLLKDLISGFPPLQIGHKILFDIEFDRYRSTPGRITIRFPNSDIPKLVKFL
jgi:hypothetical protein